MKDYEKVKGGWRFSDGIIITHLDYNRALESTFGANKKLIRALKKTKEHEILCYLHSEVVEMVRIYMERHANDIRKE